MIADISSNYYGVSVKYGAKWVTSLRFWGEKDWIKSIDPYGWFQWYFRYWLGRRSYDDEKQIARWKGIVSRFNCKFVKMIKDINGRCDDYEVCLIIRQVLLHCGYELVEDNFS